MDSGTINLIISFIFVLILIVGFFIGFWRGVRRSAVSCAIGLIGVIIAFFITPPITNAIMGISLSIDGQSVTISQYIIDQLNQNQDIASLIQDNPNLKSLIEQIPSAVANVIIFMVVTALMMLLLYIVYKIIAVTCLKRKEDQKMYRTWGGVIGLVKAFVITIFVFMPFSSLIGLVSDISQSANIYVQEEVVENQLLGDAVLEGDSQENTQEGEQSQETGETAQETEQTPVDTRSAIGKLLPQEVSDIISGLNNSFFFKMQSAVSVDDAMFDYLSAVELNGEKLYIRQEINSYANVYNVAMEISELSSSQHTFAELDFDQLEIYLNDILDGTLFRQILVEVIEDFVSNYQNYSSFISAEQLEQYKELLDDIASGFAKALENGEDGVINYLKDDINAIFNIFKELAKSGIIDQILAQQDITTESILNMLVDNTEVFSNSIENLFSMNILHDGFNFIFNNFVATSVEGLDQISADTSNWQDEDWNNLASQVKTVITDFSAVASQVDVMKVINDPTSILVKDDENNVDIIAVMSGLGKFIDSVLDVTILQNEQGQSILDNLLKSHNFILPAEAVKNNAGEEVILANYQEYLSFIAQSLQEIKDNDLYTILTSSSGATSIIKEFANLISQEGNKNLLANIFLPLIQVEPTKSLVGDELVSAVQSSLIDLSSIEGYDMWKSELGYVSDILIVLNKTDKNGTSYLDYAISGNADMLLQNLGENVTITEIMTPVLHATSTEGIKQTLFDTVANLLNQLASTNITIDITKVSFEEGDIEDQTAEICTILENIVEIYNQYTEAGEGFTFSSIDKNTLGVLLDSIKANAYRVELSEKEQEGIFKPVFEGLYNKIKEDYSAVASIVGDKEIYQISFESLMNAVVEIENADVDSFIGKVGNIITSSAGEVTVETIEGLINSVTEETTDDMLDTIDTVLGALDEFDVKIEIPGESAEIIEENKDKISSIINNNTVINDEIKNKLNNIFGLPSTETEN